ncbi:MAG: dihydropteroate synthase [Bacteroidales bacterium]|nr:dihydropteroate synthase [Bacteroidales bacterium]
MRPFSLNIRGHLHEYNVPVVMGILNVTPDSFYAESRAFTDEEIARRVRQLIAHGADIIDVGAYSSRPGAADVSAAEEKDRLKRGMEILRSIAPQAIVSVDTFRAEVARIAVAELGCDIVNDISGGNLDPEMMETVAALRCPYILMHMRGTPTDMQEFTDYEDVTADVLSELGDRLQQLAFLGVEDIIVDPGFGFSKTMEQNYRLMHDLNLFGIFHRPILVGVSRKSMITRKLGITTADALPATTALNTLALDRGADILRVHDVEAARHAVEMYTAVTSAGKH